MENILLESVEFFKLMLRHSVSRVSYFETSSSKLLTPVEALEEAKEAIEAYYSEPEQTWRAIPYALDRVTYSISTSVLSRKLRELEYVHLLNYNIDQFKSEYVQLTRGRREFVNRSVQGLASRLNNAIKDVNSTYPNYLIDKAMDGLNGTRSVATNRDKISKVVPELCTYLNYQGRDVDTVAEQVEQFIQEARAKSPYDIAEQVSRLLRSSRSSYQVATVITGAVNANVPPNAGGNTIKFADRVSWSRRMDTAGDSVNKQRNSNRRRTNKKQNRGSKYANLDLMNFCLEHWKTEPGKSNADHRVSAQVVLWRMDAWDPIHARHLALDRAESLMDRINAEHRVGEFGVKRKVLVWKSGDTRTTYLTDVFEGPKNTRVMEGHRSPSVQRSLRLASRASSERAGAMAVFFGWTALEYLGRGNQILEANNKPMTPQNFIAKFVPKVAGLVALHHLANDVSFSIVDVKPVKEWGRTLQEFLKLKSKTAPSEHVDQRNLFYLLAATNSEAACQHLAEHLKTNPHEAQTALTELEELIKEVDPISRYRIRQIKYLLHSPARMAEYLSQVEKAADVALQRMRYVRNQTAHSNIPESIRYRTLSNAMREVLDTCYQAIDKGEGHAPHEILHNLAIQFDDLLTDLREGNDEKMFKPHRALYGFN